MAEIAYQSVYKQFFEEFAATVNPDDQLPVKVAGYCICDYELHGEIVDWILQYLSQKRCPSSLIAPLTKIVVAEITAAMKRQPEDLGYRKEDKAYQPLRLMQVVTAKVNEVCLRYLDPATLATLAAPAPELPTSVCSIKNSRRCMEDRHTVIDDFHGVFGVAGGARATYYGVFDGHAGTDAAVYAVSHLHQFLAESPLYPDHPERALMEAFLLTDKRFLEKSHRDNLHSGTTALCALLRHDLRKLYVGWLGDSQAIVVRRGVATQLVLPHKPSRLDERSRIESMGGCVMFWGMWRVNGQLAISRAIGDLDYKPYVSADADVVAVPLDDDLDFIVLACDGLWDFVTEQEATCCVYETIRESPGDLEAVSASLVRLSKQQGSVDNISVIVVFLTDPATLASLDVWPSPDPIPDAMDPAAVHAENGCPSPITPDQHTNGRHVQHVTNGAELAYQKASFQLDLDGGKCKPAVGNEDAFDEDDFGPETDVDTMDVGGDVDDVLMSPMIAAAAAAAATATAAEGDDESDGLGPRERHLAQIEADLELQRQQLSVFDPVSEPREETPTPPADDVTGGAALEPEADNVAESGDESEDEWNYYRVDPSEKKPAPAASADDVADAVDQPPPQVPTDEEELEDDDNMESRLNPNAAEFVPSPTSLMPSMEEVLSGSPFKGKHTPMDDVLVPSPTEFQREFSKRPSDLHEFANPFVPQSTDFDAPDFANGGHNGNGLDSFKHADHLFDKSEVSSTLAEFGDETSTSFTADPSEFDQKAFSTELNAFGGDLNASMAECDFLASAQATDMADVSPDPFAHNTMTLSAELQMHSAEHDFANNSNPFFDQGPMSDPLDASPLAPPMEPFPVSAVKPTPPPTPERAAFGQSDSQSPNAESGIEMDESPGAGLELSGFDELSLEPVARGDAISPRSVTPEPSSPRQEREAASHLRFEDFENIPEPDICRIPEAALFAVNESIFTAEPNILTNGVEFVTEAARPDIVAEAAVAEAVAAESIAAEKLAAESIAAEKLAAEAVAAELAAEKLAAEAAAAEAFAAEMLAAETLAAETLAAETLAAKAASAEVVPDVGQALESPAAEAEAATGDGAKALAATAVVAALAGGAVAATAAKDGKKPAAAADKAKPAAKAAAGTRPATKTVLKSNPASPTKPLASPLAGPRLSSTPKKPAAPATPTARPAVRVTTATPPRAAPKMAPLAARPKPAAAAAAPKPAPPKPAAARPAPAPARPRTALATKPAVAAVEKKPLANGDAKPPAKRPEPLASKRLVATTTAAKPLTRPATAPAVTKTTTKTTTTTIRSSVTSTAAKPAAKPAAVTNGNGVASKPRPASTLGLARAKPAPVVDKQVKETANKQISQTAGKTSTVAARATARRVAGTTTKTSTVTTTAAKPNGPIRRPAGTAVTKTVTTVTTTTESEGLPLVEPLVNIEEISRTTTAIMKDDSPIIDDNNTSVVIGTD